MGEEPWMTKHRPRSMCEMSGEGKHAVMRALFGEEKPRWRVVGGEEVDLVGLRGLEEGTEVERRGRRWRAREAAVRSADRRMLLLSGPPGVGKTTSAIAVMRDMGVDFIEINCSMERGMATSEYIESVMSRMGGASLLLEEMDNMDAPAQRVLADLIGKFEWPASRGPIVIGTCNSAELVEEPLSSLMFGVSFRKMHDEEIVLAMRRVCNMESVEVSDAVLASIARSCQSDARQALVLLQQFCEIRRCGGSSDETALERLRFMAGIFDREAEDLLEKSDRPGECFADIQDMVDRRGVHPQELFQSIATTLARRDSAKYAMSSHQKMSTQLALAGVVRTFERRIAEKPTSLQICAFLIAVRKAQSTHK
jgi:hypothetical protein